MNNSRRCPSRSHRCRSSAWPTLHLAIRFGKSLLGLVLVTACGEENTSGTESMLGSTPRATPISPSTDPAETNSSPALSNDVPNLPIPVESSESLPGGLVPLPEPVNTASTFPMSAGGAQDAGSDGSPEIDGSGGLPATTGGTRGAQGGSAGFGESGGGAPSSGAGAGGMPVVNPLPEDDRCDVAVYDPTSPPQALALTGNLGVHDPVIMEQDGTFYLFATGNELAVKTSGDLMSWDGAQEVFNQVSRPSWISQQVPGVSNLWAPDIAYFGGQYHLYYSASTFGSNTSCIGHLTRASLSSGEWTAENEPTICTNGSEDYNAIDPNVVIDIAGIPWLSFGSFWDGIRILQLNQDGQRADDELHAIASRSGGAIEAPFIVRRCGFYYLFVSFDRCCQGASSTYNIRVGRSTGVLGPYEDQSGEPMLAGGGSLLVEGNDEWHGPGHSAVIFSGDHAYDVHHAYAAGNGASRLRISELAWDDDGWPISGGP